MKKLFSRLITVYNKKFEKLYEMETIFGFTYLFDLLQEANEDDYIIRLSKYREIEIKGDEE